MKILVVNGPNLNLLGEREPEVYGAETLEQVNAWVAQQFTHHEITFYQSNHEGQIIDFLQENRHDHSFLVINPGGLTHTSVALRDAIVGCEYIAVEVHLSDIYRREAFRQMSYVKDVCIEQISGHGKHGYVEAIARLETYQANHP